VLFNKQEKQNLKGKLIIKGKHDFWEEKNDPSLPNSAAISSL